MASGQRFDFVFPDWQSLYLYEPLRWRPAESRGSSAPADTPDQEHTSMAAAMTDGDMDIDMDVGLGLEALSEAPVGDPMPTRENAGEGFISDSNNYPASPPSDTNSPTTHKVHFRGLDNLSTEDITSYLDHHFPNPAPLRIEWIDDTSANVVYRTPASALAALSALTAPSVPSSSKMDIPALTLRLALAHPSHTTASLQIRQAVLSDRKAPGAHLRSRFYLFNPDADPAERRKGGGGRSDKANYRRRTYDDREHQRRREDDERKGFDEGLYDDDEASRAKRQSRRERRDSRSSYSSADSRSRKPRVRFFDGERQNGGTRELFPAKVSRTEQARLRDRSASPTREKEVVDSDGDEAMAVPDRSRRARSLTKTNGTKELFPGKLFNDNGATSNPLFQATLNGGRKNSGETVGRELFPGRQAKTHRRSGAWDAADETADLFAIGMGVPFTDGSSDRRPGGRGRGQSLADRITVPTSDGEDVNPGLKIRGTASDGFQIKGVAQRGMSIKGWEEKSGKRELFPGKLAGGGANSGKELFADRLIGRGDKRRKAEDMFY